MSTTMTSTATVSTTMTARQAAQRLGVKVETLYAYVSRGLLERDTAADGRSSLFDRRAVEALARRGRPRQSSKATSIDLLIETRLTSLSMHAVRYRGLDVAALARGSTFEAVAQLLWLGVDGNSAEGDTTPWRGAGFSPVMRDDVAGADAIRMIVAEAWAHDPVGASGRDAAAMARSGRSLIATIVDSLPSCGATVAAHLTLADGTGPIRGSIAGRLWGKLTAQRPTPAMVGVLNAALVLLADHELAASTLAARVAASTHAGPYAVVSAGLATLSGPLHGAASSLARALLLDAEASGGRVAVDSLLGAHRLVPGFGHKVYTDADPRAIVLLELVASVAGAERIAFVDEVVAAVAERTGRGPNIDVALAALGHICGMSLDAGEVIMAVARTSGWLAHAIEEYAEAPLRFRPRASYIGE